METIFKTSYDLTMSFDLCVKLVDTAQSEQFTPSLSLVQGKKMPWRNRQYQDDLLYIEYIGELY